MAGGNFTDMNKVRPGVYYKRLIEDKISATDLPQQTLCYIAPMRWGRPITRITLDDYSRNRVYQKCGLQNNDDRMQVFAQYCRELVIANPLKGGKEAEAIIREEVATEGSIAATISAGIASATLPEDAQITSIQGSRTYTLTTFGKSGVSLIVQKVEGSWIGVVGGIPDGFVPSSPSVTGVVMKRDFSGTDVEPSEISVSYNSVTKGYSVTFDSGLTDDQVQGIESVTIESSGTRAYDLEEGFNAIVKVDGTSVASLADGWTAMTINYKVVEAEGLKAIAQYPGTLGNELSIVVVRKSGTQLEVRTTLDGSIVDSQIVATWAQFVDNDWIRLEGLRDGTPLVSDPINLSGGEDGVSELPEVVASSDLTSRNSIRLRYAFSEDDDSNVNVDGVYITVDATTLYVKRNGQILQQVSRVDHTPLSVTVTLPANLNDGDIVTIALKCFIFDDEAGEYIPVAEAAEKAGMSELEYLEMLPLDLVTDANPVAINGGNHGQSAPYGDLLNALRFESWNVLVSDDQSGTSHHYLHDYVQNLRKNCGLYRRYVICQTVEDPFSGENEYNSDFTTIIPQVWRDDKGFTSFVRGAMACCRYNVSNTYQEVPIDEDPVPMFTDREIESLLISGYSPVSKRDDNVLVIEKDINSFHEYENPVYYPLTKNRVLRTIDYSCMLVRYIWELEFCGKVTNDAIGRDMWKARVIKILKDLQSQRAIESFVEPIVIKGNKLDEVITRYGFRVLDAMEICYVELTLND